MGAIQCMKKKKKNLPKATLNLDENYQKLTS
jgi:hypothetical protein